MYITNIKSCEAKLVQLPGTVNTSVRWLLSTDQGVPHFEMRFYEIGKGGNTRYSSHPYEHEVFVIKGTGILNCGQKKQEIKLNDAIYIAPDEPHQFINNREETLRFICLIPKGKEDHLK